MTTNSTKTNPTTTKFAGSLRAGVAHSSLAAALAATTSPAERRQGRFLRAPDHPAPVAAAPDPGAPPPASPSPEGGNGAGDNPATAAGGEPAPGGDPAAPAPAAEPAPGAEPPASDDVPATAAGGEPAPAIAVLGAPEAYEVKAPEGMEFDTEVFDAVAPKLKELNLSNDAAQQLVDVYAGQVLPMLEQRAIKAAETKTATDSQTLRNKWLEDSKADPEIGGANFDRTINQVGKVWDTYGIKPDSEFRQVLNDSGLGNHPDVLRFLSRVGDSISEGRFIPPAAHGGTDNRPIWDRVYSDPVPAS